MRQFCLFFLFFFNLLTGATGFQFRTQSTRTRISTRTLLFVGGRNDNNNENDPLESYIPESSFGSEVVPEGQRPVNEYLDVLRQPLFDWACLETGGKGLLTRLAILYGVVFAVVCYPIAGATFTQSGYELQKVAASNFGAMVLVLFILIRLYSGWGYVGSRLSSKSIEYEETGWYDGNVEMKTETEQMRDKFLFDSKVKPVVDRLKTFTLSCVGLCVASFIAWNVAYSQKPLFNQYDPDMLENLRYDEKLANTAAVKSAGRPTYCDSRYYRAVAGGQGCQ